MLLTHSSKAQDPGQPISKFHLPAIALVQNGHMTPAAGIRIHSKDFMALSEEKFSLHGADGRMACHREAVSSYLPLYTALKSLFDKVHAEEHKLRDEDKVLLMLLKQLDLAVPKVRYMHGLLFSFFKT